MSVCTIAVGIAVVVIVSGVLIAIVERTSKRA